MKNLRILVTAVPLMLLPAASVSAQTRMALTGGVTRWVEESCRVPFTPGRAGGGGAHPATCDEEYRYADTSSGLSVGLSGIVPLPRAFEVEVGGVFSRHGRWHSGSQLALMALGRVNLPLAENQPRAFLVAGPALAREICPSGKSYPGNARACGRQKWHVDVSLGAALEHRLADNLGLALGAVYRYGLRNFLESPDPGEFKRLRALVVRSGLVYRID